MSVPALELSSYSFFYTVWAFCHHSFLFHLRPFKREKRRQPSMCVAGRFAELNWLNSGPPLAAGATSISKPIRVFPLPSKLTWTILILNTRQEEWTKAWKALEVPGAWATWKEQQRLGSGCKEIWWLAPKAASPSLFLFHSDLQNSRDVSA